jgi:drug/metabolite transporter (DMT)-like permease
VFTACVVMPVAAYNGISIAGSRPWFAVAAGVMAGIALLIFNQVQATTPSQDLSPLFVVLLMAQLVPSVVHYVMEKGNLPTMKLVGVVFAIAAAVLVNWPTPEKMVAVASQP